ncbi:POMP91A domain protein [Chlamydia psittaci GR9]|nr:POMP91A domain protein [Chlamydia psittaci GR9]
MDISVNGADYHRGFWVSGLGNFLHKSGSDTKRKFRHNSAGYALGVYAQTPSEDVILGIRSSQLPTQKWF